MVDRYLLKEYEKIDENNYSDMKVCPQCNLFLRWNEIKKRWICPSCGK